MQTEINQLKTDVKNKDEEIQKKDSEVSVLDFFPISECYILCSTKCKNYVTLCLGL